MQIAKKVKCIRLNNHFYKKPNNINLDSNKEIKCIIIKNG